MKKVNPLIQLEASKSSIKDLFNDLLDEMKGFKYQITLKVELKNCKPNGETEFTPTYFSSTTKPVISRLLGLVKSLQEILYSIERWVSEWSDCIVELIESQYINISWLLSGRSYVKLPTELKSPKKGLINIKNNDQKYFLWCHVWHINPVKIHPERIT